MAEWIYVAIGGAVTLFVSLIGVVWWMLQKQISLRDEFQADRIKLLREMVEERIALEHDVVDRRFSGVDQRFSGVDGEVQILRKRTHDIVEKLIAIRTVVSHGLLGKRFEDDEG